MTNKFPNVSDYLILSFLNTRIVKNGKVTELITNKKDLLDWFETVLNRGTPYDYQLKLFKNYFETMEDISGVIAFRNLLFTQLSAFMDGQMSLIELKNLITLTTASFPFSLVGVEESFAMTPTVIHQDSFKSLILLDLANLIANNESHKLSNCANPECMLLFINRTGRRKWCSMQICGNRKKVENFVKRSKQSKVVDN